MAAPLNYTTSIAAHKTVGEIQHLLASHGASRIGVDYDNAAPIGVSFALVTPHGPRVFALPVNVEAMQCLLVAKDKAGDLRSGSKALRTSREQAERVAWRVTKDWLAAQLALVETQMASMDQVFLPYLRVDDQHTLYQRYVQHEHLAIGGGE